jgi:hypothetical protein
MNTLPLEQALGNLDKRIVKKVIESYREIKNRYYKGLYNLEHDATGLSSGKFCEAVIRLIQKELTGSSTNFGVHISNFNQECQRLMQLPATTGNESLRIIMPRALMFLYTIRGKRGIGHVGGDVEANAIDIETIVRVSDWIVCELIRIFHNLSLEEAQEIVDSISNKLMPEVWHIAGKKRILATGLDSKQKTLILLYSGNNNYEFVDDLCEWVEYSTISMYKTRVLKPLHSLKQIEFDSINDIVYLSPLGILEVESKILPKVINDKK